MKVIMPDGTFQEISSFEIAQPCARRLRELVERLDNITTNYANDGEVMGVRPGDGNAATTIGRRLDDGWRPTTQKPLIGRQEEQS